MLIRRKRFLVFSLAMFAVLNNCAQASEQQSTNSIGATKYVGTDIDWNAVLLPSAHYQMCNFGLASAIDGMGNRQGTPLELRYLDSPIDLPKANTEVWREWNKSVEKALNQKLSTFSERVQANDKLVVAEVDFDVTKSGKIQRVKINNYSENAEFAVLIEKALKSIETNPCLRFPKGAPAATITKSGRFSQNYGISFIETRSGGSRTSINTQQINTAKN